MPVRDLRDHDNKLVLSFLFVSFLICSLTLTSLLPEQNTRRRRDRLSTSRVVHRRAALDASARCERPARDRPALLTISFTDAPLQQQRTANAYAHAIPQGRERDRQRHTLCGDESARRYERELAVPRKRATTAAARGEHLDVCDHERSRNIDAAFPKYCCIFVFFLILSMFGILKILMFFHFQNVTYAFMSGHWHVMQLRLGRAASISKSS